MKDLCQKWTVKLIFRDTYRLSGTGIVDSLEIIDVGCNLKQFDGLTWLNLTQKLRITTYLRHCATHLWTLETHRIDYAEIPKHLIGMQNLLSS